MSRTVVITGAGGGLGSIFAKEFAKTGYRVAILDFNIQAGQKVACEIEQLAAMPQHSRWMLRTKLRWKRPAMLWCSTLAAMKC